MSHCGRWGEGAGDGGRGPGGGEGAIKTGRLTCNFRACRKAESMEDGETYSCKVNERGGMGER